jgi:hypothetical protein
VVEVVPVLPLTLPVVVLGVVLVVPVVPVELCPELIPLPVPVVPLLLVPIVLVVPTVLFDPAAVVPPATPPGVCTGDANAPVAPAGVAVVWPDDGTPTDDPATPPDPTVLLGVVPAVPAPVVAAVPGVAVPAAPAPAAPPVWATAHVAVKISPNVSPTILRITLPSLFARV